MSILLMKLYSLLTTWKLRSFLSELTDAVVLMRGISS